MNNLLKCSGVLLIIAMFCSLLCGCDQQSPGVTQSPGVAEIPGGIGISGTVFLQKGYQVKMEVTPKKADSMDPMIFEVYVDNAGNGKGMLGYKDDVYQVVVLKDKVYVQIAANTVASISDLSGHLVPSSLKLDTVSDIGAVGFSEGESNLLNFRYVNADASYSGIFMENNTVQTVTSVSSGNTMTMNAFITYILNNSQGLYIDPSVLGSQAPDVVKESFYNENWMGIEIHGQVYSIGDYCNPTTFFEESVPEGIIPSYAYKGDERVELQTISYISQDGRTSFMTTEGYVQSISTSSPFKWLSFESGMSADEVKYAVGYKLGKKDQETWKPVAEGLECIGYAKNVYTLKYEQYTISLTIDKKTHALSEIAFANHLDFLE